MNPAINPAGEPGLGGMGALVKSKVDSSSDDWSNACVDNTYFPMEQNCDDDYNPVYGRRR